MPEKSIILSYQVCGYRHTGSHFHVGKSAFSFSAFNSNSLNSASLKSQAFCASAYDASRALCALTNFLCIGRTIQKKICGCVRIKGPLVGNLKNEIANNK